MKIEEVLQKDCIRSHLQSKMKDEVIREISEVVAAAHPEIDPSELCNILTERERLGSTGIGNGVAILHGKMTSLQNIVTGFGRSVEGINFDAQDGAPVHLFFLLIAPKNSASLHLKAMARLSRLLKDGHFRNRLFEADSPEAILDVIVTEDQKF